MPKIFERLDIALNVLTNRRRYVYVEMTEKAYNQMRSTRPVKNIPVCKFGNMPANRAAQLLRLTGEVQTSTEKLIDEIMSKP